MTYDCCEHCVPRDISHPYGANRHVGPCPHGCNQDEEAAS